MISLRDVQDAMAKFCDDKGINSQAKFHRKIKKSWGTDCYNMGTYSQTGGPKVSGRHTNVFPLNERKKTNKENKKKTQKQYWDQKLQKNF